MPRHQTPTVRRSRAMRLSLVVAVLIILSGGRTVASFAIDIEWWKELGQLETFFSMLYYSIAPIAAATLVAFVALWVAHARALKFAGASLSQHRAYAWISSLVLLGIAWIIAAVSIDTWNVVRFAGSRGLPEAATRWHDAVFGKPLSFYLFDLPFYQMQRRYVLALVIVAIILYVIAARGWQLRYRLPQLRNAQEFDPA